MKPLRNSFICLILFLFGVFSCEDRSDPDEMNVERYVDLLKTGKYDYSELPPFTAKDIESLLVYRNERQRITDFPRNPISSSITEECALGMYVLWTIESIRSSAAGSEFLIGTFPSQNPVVMERDNPVGTKQHDEVHVIVADSYFEWWEANKQKDFDVFTQIDPLAKTQFQWH